MRIKRYLIPILVILVLGSGLVISCGQEASPTSTTQTDTPTLGSDEVCALVYDYLENKATATTIIIRRRELLDWLAECRPLFTATYQTGGRWQVRGVGNSGNGSAGNLDAAWGLWSVYEKSHIVEPANNEARELLSYLHWCTR